MELPAVLSSDKCRSQIDLSGNSGRLSRRPSMGARFLQGSYLSSERQRRHPKAQADPLAVQRSCRSYFVMNPYSLAYYAWNKNASDEITHEIPFHRRDRAAEGGRGVDEQKNTSAGRDGDIHRIELESILLAASRGRYGVVLSED